jgi:hypothetical protein
LRQSLVVFRREALEILDSTEDMAEINSILARHGRVTVPPGWLED